MKLVISLLLTGLASAQAYAHPSVVPHDHPHGASILPDLAALFVAVMLIAAGVYAWRLFRKG